MPLVGKLGDQRTGGGFERLGLGMEGPELRMLGL